MGAIKLPKGEVFALINGKWESVMFADSLDETDYRNLKLWWGEATAFAYNNKDITAKVLNS